MVVSTGWENVVVSSLARRKEWEGKSIEAISRETGQSPSDAALDLLLEEDGMVSIVYYHMSNKDVLQVVKWDRSLVISDSLGCETGKPHPRSYGTFPRLFSKYVREDKVLSLEQAIRKVTSFPAQRFSLGKRGLIVPGYHADLTIFNEKEIQDTATYQDPVHHPEGISHVIVNGMLTIKNKENLRQSGGNAIKAAATKCLCQRHMKQEAAHG
ncbi:amidohydrolase family protein [Fictibacillus terranigra]|uniref:Amidohydrolase family protein n=1 Tax=Fictibacillus terranigra TaxID=3058424 RepID=A0ABT8EDK9_9BACL|nr:amidohydrolase family protein [Fictibacillus sp. CENA-BCM004]MDN4076028.1 amidohydrolase family protein [Fictibacillus sp. CENA-BCM004]